MGLMHGWPLTVKTLCVCINWRGHGEISVRMRESSGFSVWTRSLVCCCVFVHTAEISMCVFREMVCTSALPATDCLIHLPSCAVVFITGSFLYKRVPPQGNILVQVCNCVGVSRLLVPSKEIRQFPKVQVSSLLFNFCVVMCWNVHFRSCSLPSRDAGRGQSSSRRGHTGWTGLRRSTR